MARPNGLITLGARVAAALLRRLPKVGITIQPFVLVREGTVPPAETIDIDQRFSHGFIGPEDIPELVRLEPAFEAAQCVDRFQRGLLCYAVKDGTRIVAKMWCDLGQINFEASQRQLGPREAYLFHALTDRAVRGQNLAPFMRLKCYEALRAMGRDTFWSYTEYFNTASRRFKRKLGAVNDSLGLYVAIAGRFRRTFTLRRYAASQ